MRTTPPPVSGARKAYSNSGKHIRPCRYIGSDVAALDRFEPKRPVAVIIVVACAEFFYVAAGNTHPGVAESPTRRTTVVRRTYGKVEKSQVPESATSKRYGHNLWPNRT